jgi:hypothetical protein
MGTDSGLNGGTSVVDTNTKVYGTDNVSGIYPDCSGYDADKYHRSTLSTLRSSLAW